MNCLPFGASASVHSFNRVARLVWAWGVTKLKLPWVNYFDDYPIASPRGLLTSSLSAAKGMLRMLGFKFAEEKLKPFAPRAEVLGVIVDCSRLELGELSYCMKESRRLEVLEALDSIIASKQLIPVTLPSFLPGASTIRGRTAGWNVWKACYVRHSSSRP